MSLTTLRQRLSELPADSLDPPPTGRVGATLVLLTPGVDDHVSVTLTRRQPTLSSHPGQISFPGGRVDDGESIVEAALREANEEIGLDPSSVTVLGRLPAFYIPPSRFWMSAVVAGWDRPHPLIPNDGEVAEIITVSTESLRDRGLWRSVQLRASGGTWAWQLAPQRLLWGATAVVTGTLLQLMDPDWSGGTQPGDLGAEHQVRPWEDPAAAGLLSAPALSAPRLRDIDSEPVAVGEGAAPGANRLAADVVTAWHRLVRRAEGSVVVLVGHGRTGDVAMTVAEHLDQDGQAVVVLNVEELNPDKAAAVIAGAGTIIDGLLGREFDPPLDDDVSSMIRLLSSTGAPIIAIDLPSGIHSTRGLVGDIVSADVTVAPAPLTPGHRAPGALPFVGDLYLSRAGHPLIRAELTSRPEAWAE